MAERHGPVVPPDGNTKATLIYLAQNPGAEEEKAGMGLVGPTGVRHWSLCQKAHLPSRELLTRESDGRRYAAGPAGTAFVANAVPVRYFKGGQLTNDVTTRQILTWVPYLRDRLPLETAKVIVAMGTPALQLVATGNYPEKWRGIMDHAGSVIPPSLCNGYLEHNAHVIPVPHTAHLLRGQDQWVPLYRRQLRRAATILKSGWVPPAFDSVVQEPWANPTDFPDVLAAAKAQGWISYDIETPRDERPTRTILIGAFATLTHAWCFSGHDVVALLHELRSLGVRIVGQNVAAFDATVCARNGWEIDWEKVCFEDTLWFDALARPRMPHKLHQLSAYWCDDAPPCWKQESSSDDPLVFREYCMRDATYAGMSYVKIRDRLLDLDMQEPMDATRAFLPDVYLCSLMGIRVDRKERKRLREFGTTAYLELQTMWKEVLHKWSAPKEDAIQRELNALIARRDTLKKEAREAVKEAKRVEKAIAKGAPHVLENDAILLHGEAQRRKDEAALVQESIPKQRALLRRYEGGINPTQSDLVMQYLYFDQDGLRLPVQRDPRTKKPTTDRKLLTQLAATVAGQKHPQLRIMTAMNSISTMLSNHLGVTVKKGNPDMESDEQLWALPGSETRNRVAVSYHPVQMRVASGKGDTVDDDLTDPTSTQVQNIPKKRIIQAMDKKWIFNLRTQYIADQRGMYVWSADWEAMEDYIWYWSMGHYIGWWDGLRALYDGADLHAEMARAVWPDAPITKQECKKYVVVVGGEERFARDEGKAAHHALKLQGGIRQLKFNRGIPEQEGRRIMAAIEATERGQKIREFQAFIEERTLREHRAFTPFNEFVDFWAVNIDKAGTVSMKDSPKACAVYQQGSAANVLKRTSPGIRKDMWAIPQGRILLFTHDEITVQGWPRYNDYIVNSLKTHMEQHWPQMPVPWDAKGLRIPTEIDRGWSWGSVEPISKKENA